MNNREHQKRRRAPYGGYRPCQIWRKRALRVHILSRGRVCLSFASLLSLRLKGGSAPLSVPSTHIYDKIYGKTGAHVQPSVDVEPGAQGGRESRRPKPRILLTAPAPAMLGREEER
jgi:hypothetical protein